jgi:MFS family permease
VIVELVFLTKGMTIPLRKLLAVIFLFSSSFAWFFVFYYYFDELISPGSVGSFWFNAGTVVFLVFTVVSAFLGSFIAGKINRRKLLFSWLIFGVLATIPILFFRGGEFLIIWGMMAGLSFGLGFPSCQAFLADSTAPEERGRVAGFGILVTFVLVVFSFLLKSVLGLESAGILLLTIGIKSIGFLSFILDPIDRVKNEAKPWRAILGYRDFNLYLLPYVLFNVAAGLVSLLWQGLPSNPDYDAVTRTGTILRYVGLCVFAIIAGWAADRIGRKKPIMLGFVMLGAAYAIVGLLTTPETYFINLLLSGFAWGIIMVVYLVVPGDLSFAGSAERFYTVGWVLPLILYIGVEGTGKLIGIAPRIDVFSTILDIVLFASVLPLLSAVETLSESKLRERRFREYTEKVGKVVQESKETDQT